MERDLEKVTEEEAARIWERATEAAKAAEIASMTAPSATIAAPTRHAGEAADGGYALTQVRSAALEAGIAPEFVDAAVADLRVERALRPPDSVGSFARRFLNNPPGTLSARKVLSVPPREVLVAMEALFVAEPYRLVLVDQFGDTLNGGVMVFDIHSNASPFNPGFGYQMQDSGVRQLAITLHPLAGSVPSCEVTVRGRVTSQKTATGLGLMLSSLAGVAGTAAGLIVGVAVAGLGVATGIVPVLVVGGAAAGGAGGVKGFRALHRRSMRLGTHALEGLLGAIAARAEGGWQRRLTK